MVGLIDKLKTKLHSSSSSTDHTSNSNPPTRSSLETSRRSSLDPAASNTRTSSRNASPVRRSGSGFSTPSKKDGTRTPTAVDSLLNKAKSLHPAPGSRSLATPASSSKNGQSTGISKNSLKKKRRQAKKEQRRKEVEQRQREQGEGGKGRMARKAEPGSKYRNEGFGYYPLMRSDPKQSEKFEYKDMSDLTEEDIGSEVTLRARVDHVRAHSSKLAFIVLRYQMEKMQAVISVPSSASSGSSGAFNGRREARSGRRDTKEVFMTPSEELGQGVRGLNIASQQGAETHVSQAQFSQAHPPVQAGSIGLAPPLDLGQDGQILNVPAVPASSVAQPAETLIMKPSAPIGQDYAGAKIGERTELGEHGLIPKDLPGQSRPRQKERLRSYKRPHDELAGYDSEDSSSSDEDEMAEDYDSEYDATHKEGEVSEDFVRWISHLNKESLVHITGRLQKPKNSKGRVDEASKGLSGMELKVQKCFVVGRAFEQAPFQLNAVEGFKVATDEEKLHGKNKKVQGEEEGGKISLRQEMNNRTFDLRAPTNQAIFRIRASVCRLFREYLDDQGFTEIQSAKLQGSATEGGASVFKLDYFGRPAYLAQSPQLAKQQAIIADMGKIYEIGSIFRAENSNTARHLTEFVGMDLEMAIDTDYHECMNVIDGVLKKIFKGVQERNKKELEVVKQRFPHQDLVIPDKTVILHYKEGVQLLRDAGHKHEDGSEIQDDEDFDTPTEKRLGAIVKEKYNTDYYILDKFPTGVRPFYTMPDPTDERYSNSFDIFVRGQEILSGGQRVHDSAMLEAKMKDSGMDPEMLSEYIHAFRLGAPPHAGGGVGLDRLIMLMLKLDNIRFASLYPRDPKSFPDSGKPPPAPRPKIGRHGTLPDISSLIAAYGDSTNTSWLDPRYTIWRHLETGAAIGYVPAKHNYGIIWGAPLCAPEDMDQVMHAWLEHCDQIKLKPIWCCVDQHTAELLSARYRWKAVSCIAEARVDPKHYLGNEESNVPKKIQGAKKAGVKVTALEGEPTDELRKELDAQIKEWQSHREGTQMHISDVSAEALTKDSKHKRFLLAKDADGKLAGIVVLAKLSPQHGEQIKWSLQFPDAPNGTSEYMLSEAMKSAMELGVASLTFGASAAEKIMPLANQKSISLKVLSRAYEGIKSAGNLGNKTSYRHKWGTTDEPLYVAYPKHGLGTRGISAIMETVTDDNEHRADKKHDQRNVRKVDELEENTKRQHHQR